MVCFQRIGFIFPIRNHNRVRVVITLLWTSGSGSEKNVFGSEATKCTYVCRIVADPDLLVPDPLVRATDPDPLSLSKNSKKTLIPTVLWLCFDFLPLKTNVNGPSKSNKQNTFLFFVGVLKVNDENSRIRIRIHKSEAWIRRSRPGPKCHGSAKLVCRVPRPGELCQPGAHLRQLVQAFHIHLLLQQLHLNNKPPVMHTAQTGLIWSN